LATAWCAPRNDLYINRSVNYAQGSTIKYSKRRTNVKRRQHEKIKQNFKMWVKHTITKFWYEYLALKFYSKKT